MRGSSRFRTHGPARAAAAVLAFAIVACDARDTARTLGDAEVRDSAGVDVVINAQPERMLTASPELRIGVIDGDPNLHFYRVRSIALDDDGGFWIADANESVRHYDAAGTFLGSVGGAGEGPGEARGYGNVWTAGDTVLAWGYPQILQLFASDGTFLDSREPRAGDRQLLVPLGFANGRWYFTIQDYTDTTTRGTFRRDVHIVARDGLNGALDTVGTFAGELTRRTRGSEFGRASYFLGNPSFAVDGLGRVLVSDTLAYSIAVYASDGALERIVQRPVEPRAYDHAWAAEVEDAVAAALSDDGAFAVQRAEIESLTSSIVPDPAPSHLPFVDGMLASRSDGTIWVERADRHPRPGMRAVAHAIGFVRWAWRPEWIAPRVFDVFAPDGVYRGTLELPSNFAPMAITHDRVYGVWYDELGVEYIATFAIEGTARARSARSDRFSTA